MGKLPLVTVFSFLSTFLYLLNVLSWLIHHFVIKKMLPEQKPVSVFLQYFQEDMILRSVLIKKKNSEYKILHCFKNQKKSPCVCEVDMMRMNILLLGWSDLRCVLSLPGSPGTRLWRASEEKEQGSKAQLPTHVMLMFNKEPSGMLVGLWQKRTHFT